MEGAVNVGENDQGLNRPQKEKGPERANRLRGILNSGRPGKPARTIPECLQKIQNVRKGKPENNLLGSVRRVHLAKVHRSDIRKLFPKFVFG